MNLRTAFDHMIPRHASWQCAGFEGRICLHQVGQNVGLKSTHFLWLKIMIHTCHIFKVKAKPLVSKIKATISHPFNRCQVITGGRCLSRGWFCDRRCSTWLGLSLGLLFSTYLSYLEMMFGKSVGFGIQQEWMNGMNHTLTLTSE